MPTPDESCSTQEAQVRDQDQQNAHQEEKERSQQSGGQKMEILQGESLAKFQDAQDFARIEQVFVYHAPFGDQAERYGLLRSEALKLAKQVCHQCPYSRERSLALTALQQAIMWANAAISINEKPGIKDEIKDGQV